MKKEKGYNWNESNKSTESSAFKVGKKINCSIASHFGVN